MNPRQSSASQSQSEAGPEHSSLRGLLDRLRRRPFEKSEAMRRVVILLASAWSLDIAARFVAEFAVADPDGSGKLLRDMAGMGALLIVGVATLYVFSVVHSNTTVRRTMLLGVCILVLTQVKDILDEVPWLHDSPLLGKGASPHVELEILAIVTGGLILVAGCFFALFEGENALRHLAVERERLAKSVSKRKRAERELKEAHEALERVVAARTAELAERNAQLRVELAERRRAEALLAMRLRYEEGLAACSHTLLADTEPNEALSRALHQLLKASQACRVYIFENYPDPQYGLCMRMLHEAWDSDKCPWCSPTPDLAFPYADGFERWRARLSKGQPVTGVVEHLPPEERVRLEPFRTKSLLLLPVGWEGHWRGFLGFDDTHNARVWTPEEISLLRTAAKMVGVCIDRQRAEEALRLAYDELEQRVAERTADLSRANEQLQKEIADRQRAEEAKHHLESQLRQAQKMQAIGTLAGGIAHDFNNILASILGYTELALRKIEADSPFYRYFDEVLKAGNRAKELVRQILLFSRQSDQERVPVHLHIIAMEVLALFRASCPPHIEIREEIDTEAGAVLADPIQMHQVILNLLTNAQHALRNGGSMTVRVEPDILDEPLNTPHGNLSPGEYVRIVVSDNGHGMDPQTMDRIFEPFFTTKNVGEGTGMGLAIVHGIVTRCGGAIQVWSQPNAGATFRVSLPRFAGSESAMSAGTMELLFGNEHILVVDDEPQLVALWRELLEQFGYRVTTYCNSVEALEAYKRDPECFDLALLDQTMPGMTGMEMARDILALRPDLPIILATGFSESISPEKAQQAGIREFVYKPILGSDLGMAVRRALDNGHAPAPRTKGASAPARNN